MNITLKEISVREIYNGYKDEKENGITGYDGKLNIRPAYQREFIYKDTQRDEVINTVRKNFPLNVMYWVKNGADSYELLDGQQRTISICSYIAGEFSIDFQYFFNLTKAEQNQILDYKLMVYICEGTDKEKLDWFRTINIAGEKLTDQELRNAMYTGEWLTDAKRHFSKTSCPAYGIASNYMNGSTIRQDYLQAALYWIAERDNISIEDYMALHQHDKNANELWLYFQNVINWIKVLFPENNYRREMKGLPWGILYNKFHSSYFDPDALEKEIVTLMLDEDVTKKSGIYPYVLDRDERHLNIRTFSEQMKREAYTRQNGLCADCGDPFDIKDMEADHIDPWHSGGKTIASNCQMLCKPCNRRKSGK